jgi:hypothetical protein
MGNFCLYASKKRADAPESFSLETGVFCSLFGITSPGCKFLDILPGLFNSISTAKKAADFIKIAYRVTKNLPDGFVDTEEFCLVEPPTLTDDDIVTWGDVFSAFNGFYPDALVEKMSKVYAYKKWFEYCRCETEPPAPNPLPPPGFPPPPEPPDPLGKCGPGYAEAISFWRSQYDFRVSAANAWLSANPGNYEYTGFVVTDETELANLRAACYPFCLATPEAGSGCICRYQTTALASGSWVEVGVPPSQARGFNVFDRQPIAFKFLPDCPEPDPIPDPIPDPDDEADNGPEFCLYFPELCRECPPANCESVAVEVPLLDRCGEPAGVITVYLNSCGGDSPPPPTCESVAVSVRGQMAALAASYACSSFQNFIDDTQPQIDQLKAESPSCEVEIEAARDAAFSDRCTGEG